MPSPIRWSSDCKAEGDKSPCDVFITTDAGRIERARQMGLLQPVTSAVLAKAVPAHLRDPDNNWFGFSKRARVIMYNKEKVTAADAPKNYEDLADPKWKGKLLIRSSGHIYNQSLVGSLLAAIGPEKTEAWAKGVAANLARPPRGGDTDQIKGVAAGEAETLRLQHLLLRQSDALEEAGGSRGRGQGRRGVPQPVEPRHARQHQRWCRGQAMRPTRKRP